MSHVVAIDVEVKDAEALAKAAERIDMIAVDTQNWDWYGKWVNDYSADNAAYKNGVSTDDYGKCEWALVQKGSPLGQAELAARAAGRRLTHAEVNALRAKHYGGDWKRNTGKPYSVGVIKNPTGPGFKLVYDFYSGGNGLRDLIGEDAARLKQAYGVECTRNVARRLGHAIVGEHTLADGSIKLKVQIKSASPKTG